MPFAVPPWLATQATYVTPSIRYHPLWGYTLGSDNGALSVTTYSGIPFGLQLRGPFTPRAVAGSHLIRLSETRWWIY